MPRPKKATDALRLSQVFDLIEREEIARSRLWTSEEIRCLLRKVGIDNPSQKQMDNLAVWLPYVAEEYARMSEDRYLDNMPSFGGVQFTPGQVIALLLPLLKQSGEIVIRTEYDIPEAMLADIARRTVGDVRMVRQAVEQIIQEAQTKTEKRGKSKRAGRPSAEYAAALLLKYVRNNVPRNTQKKRQYFFVQEALQAIGIPHPNPEQKSSEFTKFIKRAESLRV